MTEKGQIKIELLMQLVLSLLEPVIYKTTTQLVEEFRMEYPAQWRQLEKEGEVLYGNSCGSMQQPSTRISQILRSLSTDQCHCLHKNNQDYWTRKCHSDD